MKSHGIIGLTALLVLALAGGVQAQGRGHRQNQQQPRQAPPPPPAYVPPPPPRDQERQEARRQRAMEQQRQQAEQQRAMEQQRQMAEQQRRIVEQQRGMAMQQRRLEEQRERAAADQARLDRERIAAQQAAAQQRVPQLQAARQREAQRQVAQQRGAQLEAARRQQQSLAQQQYLARTREQQQRLAAQRNYAGARIVTERPIYRYYRAGRFYETGRYGAFVLRRAVRYGYQEGYRAGDLDRARGRRADFRHSLLYEDGDYGYTGSYASLLDYRGLFREGFWRGYSDGYYQRQQYGYLFGGVPRPFDTTLSSILHFALIP